MSKTISQYIGARRAKKRDYNRRKTFASAVSDMFVTATKRGVCITVVAHLDRFEHKMPRPIVAGAGFCDLDGEQIDRLIRRLAGIRSSRKKRLASTKEAA